jgi:hypothetical protein
MEPLSWSNSSQLETALLIEETSLGNIIFENMTENLSTIERIKVEGKEHLWYFGLHMKHWQRISKVRRYGRVAEHLRVRDIDNELMYYFDISALVQNLDCPEFDISLNDRASLPLQISELALKMFSKNMEQVAFYFFRLTSKSFWRLLAAYRHVGSICFFSCLTGWESPKDLGDAFAESKFKKLSLTLGMTKGDDDEEKYREFKTILGQLGQFESVKESLNSVNPTFGIEDKKITEILHESGFTNL